MAAGLVFEGQGGRLHVPTGLTQILSHPLGAGPGLRVLLGEVPVERMRQIQAALGLPKQKNRAATVNALVDYFSDGPRVRALVDTAPAPVRDWLIQEATGARPSPQAEFQPKTYRDQQNAARWAAEHGLMVGAVYGYPGQMSAEAAMALRGPDYRAPFTPRQPLPAATSVDHTRLQTSQAAAVMEFSNRVITVLDRIAHTPVPAIKAGGIGVRELTKLTTTTGGTEHTMRLVLELAGRLGLLTQTGRTVAVTDQYPIWRDSEPAARYAGLIHAWWEADTALTASRDSDGKPVRALTPQQPCTHCRRSRLALLETLASIPGATTLDAISPAVTWLVPTSHYPAADGSTPGSTTWEEAHTLALITGGALTPLGHALHVRNPATLHHILAEILPQPTNKATFGSDLTAYVTGTPTRHVSTLLDHTANRESSSAATIWRFTPTSIRHAMDAGTTPTTLIEELTGIATTPLPQPLTYLITDIGRRHGLLRITPTFTCIHSHDTTLLAEITSDRKLTKLDLRLLAPTVITTPTPPATILKALQDAGHYPVTEDHTGLIHLPPPPRRPPAHTPPANRAPSITKPAPNLHKIAARLLRTPIASPATATRTETLLTRQAKHLSPAEVRQLAHAIDTHNRIRITYQSRTGAPTQRTIDHLRLSGPYLYAWCELRNAERVFTLTNIHTVTTPNTTAS